MKKPSGTFLKKKLYEESRDERTLTRCGKSAIMKEENVLRKISACQYEIFSLHRKRGKERTNGAIKKGQIEDDHYKGQNFALFLVGEDIIEI